QHDHDALFFLNPKEEKPVRGAVYSFRDFRVRDQLVLAEKGCLCAAPLANVAVHKMICDVVPVRKLDPIHPQIIQGSAGCAASMQKGGAMPLSKHRPGGFVRTLKRDSVVQEQ